MEGHPAFTIFKILRKYVCTYMYAGQRCLPALYSGRETSLPLSFEFKVTYMEAKPVHKGAICQFPVRWIFYCQSSESTGKKTDKTHLCAVPAVSRRITIDQSFKTYQVFDMPKTQNNLNWYLSQYIGIWYLV